MTTLRISFLWFPFLRKKPSITRCLLLFSIFYFLSVGCLTALDPSQPASSYLRKHFTVDDGLSATVVDGIVQTPDGFLWLTVNGIGLVRFDGTRFYSFERPWALAMAVSSNGDLWAGIGRILSRIPSADLNQSDLRKSITKQSYPGGTGRISALHFSQSGVLWVGTYDGIFRYENGQFSPVGPRVETYQIEEAPNGHILAHTQLGFMELDDSLVVPHPGLAAQLGVKDTEIFYVMEDSHGSTWYCTAKGVARQTGGQIEKLAAYGAHGHAAYRAYEDRQGNMWIATEQGLFRATAGGLEPVAPGMQVRSMYSDRDGDLWVGTNGDGLYRFKDRAARMFTTADGLPNNLIMTVLVARDGAVWTGANCGGISRFDGSHFRTYNEKDGLVNSCVSALAEDANRDIWIGTYNGGAFRFHDGRFTQYSKDQGLSEVASIFAAPDGSVWIASPPIGIIRIRDGQLRTYTKADGLSTHAVERVMQDRAGEIWAGTDKGLDRLAGGRFVNFSSIPNAPEGPIGETSSAGILVSNYNDKVYRIEKDHVDTIPAVGITDMIETDEGDLWFSGQRIRRVPRESFAKLRASDEPFSYEPYGPADGLATSLTSDGVHTMAIGRDGKLWMATPKGLAMFDLKRLWKTDENPAIYVQAATVGRNSQDPGHNLVLPPGTHHVELDFSAVEISSPEKIRMQYRLDGVDSEWLDAGPNPHAIYSDMPAGTHAFHIRACNRNGIWDLKGITYKVTQLPYFYQTRWFLAAVILTVMLSVTGLYRLRLQQVTARLTAGLEERLAERTRIARELHDTLLQSFHGLLLRLQTASYLLPSRPDEAKTKLDNVIEQASQAIAEGRDAVQSLRSSTVATNDLPIAIRTVVEELAAAETSRTAPIVDVAVEGAPRELHPIVRDEAYRIATEVLRNAFQHAQANHLEVEIRYDAHELRLRVRDDGKGIDPKVLSGDGREGHYGLHGMRERAEVVGGKLTLWSDLNSGTEVELSIPAAAAYATSPRRSWLFEKFSGRETQTKRES